MGCGSWSWLRCRGARRVVHAVASTLSISPEAGSTLLESIVDALAGRRALVVLDNCEHVIDAAAEIAAAVGQERRAGDAPGKRAV